MNDPQSRVVVKIKKPTSNSQNDVDAHFPVQTHASLLILQVFHFPFKDRTVSRIVTNQLLLKQDIYKRLGIQFRDQPNINESKLLLGMYS
jgi:hypothetical protein